MGVRSIKACRMRKAVVLWFQKIGGRNSLSCCLLECRPRGRGEVDGAGTYGRIISKLSTRGRHVALLPYRKMATSLGTMRGQRRLLGRSGMEEMLRKGEETTGESGSARSGTR